MLVRAPSFRGWAEPMSGPAHPIGGPTNASGSCFGPDGRFGQGGAQCCGSNLSHWFMRQPLASAGSPGPVLGDETSAADCGAWSGRRLTGSGHCWHRRLSAGQRPGPEPGGAGPAGSEHRPADRLRMAHPQTHHVRPEPGCRVMPPPAGRDDVRLVQGAGPDGRGPRSRMTPARARMGSLSASLRHTSAYDSGSISVTGR